MNFEKKKDNHDKQLVSCIVPVLNEGDTISDFILSLYQQDHRPIELLIIDGESSDETVDKNPQRSGPPDSRHPE